MNYCFGDFEFTCGRKREKESRELLSAGLIFYDTHFRELFRYYKTAKPVLAPNLTNFCKNLTGLTQEEIDASEDSSVICQDILNLFKTYHVDTIFTMGNCDAPDLREDAAIHKQLGIQQAHTGNEIADVILDIQQPLKIFSRIQGKESIGIQKYLDFYQISVDGSLHNSLVDATALAQIYKHIIYERNITKTPAIIEYEENLARREAKIKKEKEKRLLTKQMLKEQSGNPAIHKKCAGYIALRKEPPQVIPFQSKKERSTILAQCQGISCQLFLPEQETEAKHWAEQESAPKRYPFRHNRKR